MNTNNTVFLYTDGSCSKNPGPGGWGYALFYNTSQKDDYGHALETTNNRMELQAVIEGLNALTRPMPVRVFTDSKYVMDGATQWMHGWKAKNWQKKGGLKNADLWQKLDKALAPHTVEWEWVKGHSGDTWNEHVDKLAVKGTQKAQAILAKQNGKSRAEAES